MTAMLSETATRYHEVELSDELDLEKEQRMKENKEYILSLSYGKDSIACLFAIEQLGLPLDRIVHAEVWATEDILADLPEMVEFKKKADKIIKDRWGIEVEHIYCNKIDSIEKEKVSFEDYFYKVMEKGKFVGNIKGFPMTKRAWCNQLKLQAINRLNNNNSINYLGIANDEPERIERQKDKTNIILPLVEIGWDEAYCRKICEENDLLSPIYSSSTRGVLVLS